MNLKLIEFLSKEVPSSAGDIREALDLLSSSIDMAVDQIGEKIGERYSNREFDKIDELTSNSKELNEIIKKVQKVIENIDDSIDGLGSNLDKEYRYDEKFIPNYDEYLVDSKLEHNLYEDLTNKRPCAFEIENKRVEIKDWKSTLVETLNYLAEKDPNIIEKFVEDSKMNGKKVVYFSDEKLRTMRAARKIENVNIYVETNMSANSIRNLLIKVLKKYNIGLNEYKIYLRADYSKLHL